MSDYGDDYSDYGDDWFYVEDGFAVADDLAEHAIASPPPTTYGDDDDQEEWDRFDYFNDLEYASDGYDDATFAPHDAPGARIGQKRKRTGSSSRGKKKQRLAEVKPCAPLHSPVVWRAHSDRAPNQRLLADNAPSYALLKNWREVLPTTPEWARGSPPPAKSPSLSPDDVLGALASQLLQPASEPLDDDALTEDEEMDEEGEVNLSQDVLMAALQRQLAAAGGPLSGMDPQQLLQFAMRMATDKDAGDDIAGEMADAMLGGDEEDEDAGTQENLLSWVAQQRNANKDAAATEPKSPEASRNDTIRPPTPPSSEANRSIKVTETNTKPNGTKSKTWTAQETKLAPSLKRKAEEGEEVAGPSKTTKKRATRSFDASTAASEAKAAPTRTTRSTRSKR
ncbi:hypothetical protein DE146DRAFT_139832 [Phaeosphaeria sp. MPI-PUGE-AT-0046c]|nr:hypothetical protein DE146DRAFT_139832 [Phaeosphaeria sp. MPI-PUGE-AT-0046c]